MHHLGYLLEDAVPAILLCRSGLLVTGPGPERFAIHKLIVAEWREQGSDRLKAGKDRAQADVLISVPAETRNDELRDTLDDAIGRGPGWCSRRVDSLKKAPASAGLNA